MEQSLITDTWHHCYDEGLQQLIVPEAFSHPAKMAWGLAQRIMAHLGECWHDARDGLLLDPMAGIGTVGLAGVYAGYRTILGELEGHFATLCAENIALHAERLRALGKPVPLLFRHDAQALPLGGAGCVVTSPPYVNAVHGHNGIDHTKLTGKQAGPNSQASAQGYGTHPAQLGNLRAVVSSPPFMSTHAGHDSNNYFSSIGGVGGVAAKYSDEHPRNQTRGGDRTSLKAKERQQQRVSGNKNIGTIVQSGNAGIINTADYWSAMSRVYRECARVLPPGAPIILVVKGYISKGAYVDLPMQTAQLLEDCGFAMVHWHEASLVSRESQLGLFGGETRKSRKSFFRRLAERNGAPPIDAEIVLCAERG